MTHQKSSGRCWLFAALNVIRLPFAKKLNIDDFEFSQNYLFFWDKIERCNFALHNILETAKRNESIDGRLVSFILHVSTCFFKILNDLLVRKQHICSLQNNSTKISLFRRVNFGRVNQFQRPLVNYRNNNNLIFLQLVIGCFQPVKC